MSPVISLSEILVHGNEGISFVNFWKLRIEALGLTFGTMSKVEVHDLLRYSPYFEPTSAQ